MLLGFLGFRFHWERVEVVVGGGGGGGKKEEGNKPTLEV